MGTVNTSKGALHTYAEGDHPGAGSQVAKGGGGLNDNWWILDDAVFTEHNVDGSHKATVIKGSNLIQTGTNAVVDETTLEFSANEMRVKALGVDKGHLATTVADAVTLEKDASVGLRIKDGGVRANKILGSGTGKAVDNISIGTNGSGELEVKADGISGAMLNAAVVDNSTIELASDVLRLKDDGIQAAKIAHNNNRTKFCISFGGKSSYWMYHHGQVCSASIGWVAPRNGCITRITCVDTSGGKWLRDLGWNISGDQHFNATDVISGYVKTSGDFVGICINGAKLLDVTLTDAFPDAAIIVCEIEFENA